MRLLIFVFFAICLFGQDLKAQVVDMRAYSRQRGSRAYTPQTPIVKQRPARRMPVPVKKEEPSTAKETDQKIRQTGVKVFQEKDEEKVLNFNVENPEFDKLSDYKKQDLMNRISFEKNTD